MHKIPRFRLNITPDETKSLLNSFRQGELVLGKDLDKFKKNLSKLFNKNYCALTANGFTSILLAILSTNTKGKNILIPAISTCFSFFNAIKASGNYPLFADVELESGNIDYSSASKEYKNKKYDLIISPNYFGIPSKIKKLKSIGVPVIEDCAQSFFTNAKLSSSADLQIFSFYPTKIINAIDGGAVLTDNKIAAQYIEKRIYYADQFKPDAITRYNFRMPNIHASVGLSALRRKNETEKKYKYIIKRYREVLNSFDNCSLLGQKESENVILSKFIIKFHDKTTRNKFIATMKKKEVPCMNEFIPLVNLAKSYKNSSLLLNTISSIPLYESLTMPEINYICKCLHQALKKI